jgi:spermidine/putrescine transport system ATP-binding protein
MNLLSVENVTKRFGDLVAVNNASFAISDGEFVSILGPSGSGKSTILRMIAGFETPTEGDLSIRNQSIVGVPPFERDVNMVFQSLALFPHLSVAENIAYGLKNQDVPKGEREDRIKRMLEMVRLEGYGPRDPAELSGGEQQRVALARALVNEPEIVLFDEPLASLDRKLRQHMQVELQRIQSETGITFLYVTHDQEVAMAVSDRLVLLNDGEIEQIGTAKDLYETPVSEFVADFIGDVNNVPVRLVEENESTATLETRNGDRSWVVPSIGWPTEKQIRLCVRPHAIELFNEEPETPFTAKGEIQNRIYQGEIVEYIIDTDIGSITVSTDTEQFNIGDVVYVGWTMDGSHVFADGESIELTDTTQTLGA